MSMGSTISLFNCLSHPYLSVCQEVAGEPLYMLYRAIKYQVDKGPVDAVTGKAKRTLNDSHLLREDIDYCAMVTMDTTIVCAAHHWFIYNWKSGCSERTCPSLHLCVSDSNCLGEERGGGSAMSC